MKRQHNAPGTDDVQRKRNKSAAKTAPGEPESDEDSDEQPIKTGQHISIPDLLRSVVKDYPSENIVKEFVQNAEDAQATSFHM